MTSATALGSMRAACRSIGGVSGSRRVFDQDRLGVLDTVSSARSVMTSRARASRVTNSMSLGGSVV